LALPYLVLFSTGSALAAGIVGTANLLPAVLCALWLGASVDRRPPLLALVCSDLARAALFALLALALIDISAPWIIAGIVFVAGIADVWFRIAARAPLPGIVPKEHLVTANGYLEAVDAATTLAGPGIGGLLL
jgi:hypothetical protein